MRHHPLRPIGFGSTAPAVQAHWPCISVFKIDYIIELTTQEYHDSMPHEIRTRGRDFDHFARQAGWQSNGGVFANVWIDVSSADNPTQPWEVRSPTGTKPMFHALPIRRGTPTWQGGHILQRNDWKRDHRQRDHWQRDHRKRGQWRRNGRLRDNR